jgi:hypothetical protein
MNPMLLVDWGHIHRLFRGLMWLVAIALACLVVSVASPHSSAGHARPDPRTLTLTPMHGAGVSAVNPRK